MLKEERQKTLLDLLAEKQILRVAEITKQLGVTDMTVRRDLQELDEKGLLTRVHGGAKALPHGTLSPLELSHIEKKDINLTAKQEIAQLAAGQIEEGDTVFLGPGTTIELVYDYLNIQNAKIVTNSIHVFDKFKNDLRFDLILIGGVYRPRTGAFVGTIANDFMSTIHVQKAFIGVNALSGAAVYNSNEDEGLTQAHILESAEQKYIVADYSKFNKRDFYKFYDLNKADFLITDAAVDSADDVYYSDIIQLIKP
ncbi:DeoR/GlpR family DNA-binding transcription regulator [Vagococcus acidifermentans]|uniref:Lactose phosphotransferase system repressor n=1 Tax=Vagococcus acidifermentans TaxID=564710 RepID=A0A430B324_9ENTE|nr:DeoR/GlpR family DNA-binding transcription regulator [Vagococcus acidifermentans]RSU14714.1 DeoR family transcriptional regulator [Vagococcus acidifermentans]